MIIKQSLMFHEAIIYELKWTLFETFSTLNLLSTLQDNIYFYSIEWYFIHLGLMKLRFYKFQWGIFFYSFFFLIEWS